jgi:hypothetical protein
VAVLGIVFSAALIALLFWLLGGEDTPPTAADEVAAERADAEATTTSTAGSSDPAQDPLCALHDERIAAVNAAGPAGTPAAVEASIRAQLVFYAAAADVTEGADAAAFLAMAEYFDAWRRFHEPRGWNPQVDLAEAAQIPVATPGAGTRTSEVLEARCGVTVAPDNPG